MFKGTLKRFQTVFSKIIITGIRSPSEIGPYLRRRKVERANKKVRQHLVTPAKSDLVEFQEVVDHCQTWTDISDHLPDLFIESLKHDPGLIVELGVRRGESTFVLERVAKLTDAKLVSVDIEDCSDVSNWDEWHFVQEDDIKFADRFEEYCKENDLPDSIDVLFIDTSHLYEHTKAEINHWFPHLADNAIVALHDTNMDVVYHRENGSLGLGAIAEDRGVIRALEDYFETTFVATRNFRIIHKNWIIRHQASCNGFTILYKLPKDFASE